MQLTEVKAMIAVALESGHAIVPTSKDSNTQYSLPDLCDVMLSRHIASSLVVWFRYVACGCFGGEVWRKPNRGTVLRLRLWVEIKSETNTQHHFILSALFTEKIL